MCADGKSHERGGWVSEGLVRKTIRFQQKRSLTCSFYGSTHLFPPYSILTGGPSIRGKVDPIWVRNERDNICIYGCKWRRLCPQPTGPCHSARLQSPTQPQSPVIPIPIRITHFFYTSKLRLLVDRLTTAIISFYTCIVSVLSITAIFLNCEQCFIADAYTCIHMHTDVGMLSQLPFEPGHKPSLALFLPSLSPSLTENTKILSIIDFYLYDMDMDSLD